MMSDAHFERYRALVERESGIHLAPHKRPLLVARLTRRLRDLGDDDFGRYLDRISSDPEERVRFIDAICTNETQFFREPRHFAELSERLLPRIARGAPRRIRALSAACSSGEEAWSIAMTLLARFPTQSGFELEVQAVDLSSRVLARATTAIYSAERIKDVPQPMRNPFLLRGVGSREGLVKIAPEVRALVHFRRGNLATGDSLPDGPFDLIFCRNVLIFFGTTTRHAVISRLVERLAPRGWIALGHAEGLGARRHGLRVVGPTMYERDTS